MKFIKIFTYSFANLTLKWGGDLNQYKQNKDNEFTNQTLGSTGGTGDYIQLIGAIASIIGESIGIYGQGISIMEDQQEQIEQQKQKEKVENEINQLKQQINKLHMQQDQQMQQLNELSKETKARQNDIRLLNENRHDNQK